MSLLDDWLAKLRGKATEEAGKAAVGAAAATAQKAVSSFADDFLSFAEVELADARAARGLEDGEEPKSPAVASDEEEAAVKAAEAPALSARERREAREAKAREELERLLGPLKAGNTPAPGTLAAHYAPLAGVFISSSPEEDAARLRADGRRVRVLAAGPPEEHARRLYRELRKADADGVEIVVAERARDEGLGTAINDRLQRAAVGSPAAPHSRVE